MKKSLFLFVIILIFFFMAGTAFPLTLVRVGYIDLDHIVKVFTEKYLNLEISIRENYIKQLQEKYNQDYYNLSYEELDKLQTEISDQDSVLKTLKDNKFSWDNNEQIEDSVIQQIIQKNIMNAIKKTSEVEGYNLILDKTGNFVYGTEDINLTDKVLFRLDEKLLELQNSNPVAPLSLELEENPVQQNQPIAPSTTPSTNNTNNTNNTSNTSNPNPENKQNSVQPSTNNNQ